jgi:hypothetical protein
MKTKTAFKNYIVLIALLFLMMVSGLKLLAQPYPFMLSPSGDCDKYFTFYPKIYTINSTNYITGFLSLSAYRNSTGTGTYFDDFAPVQKLQISGGNILLSRIVNPNLRLDPTSRNGAILFGNLINSNNSSGKWGIEYDDEFSTGGLNFFNPISSLTPTRINHNLFIRDDGNVGIGTGEPSAKLHIADGDIFIQDIDRGIIMKSPDGKCWRGTLNNQGQLQFTELPDCTLTGDKSKPEGTTSSVIFPNPASNTLNINLTKFSNQPVSLNIFSTTGQHIAGKQTSGQSQEDFDISNLTSGTYTLIITSTNTYETHTFVKQ